MSLHVPKNKIENQKKPRKRTQSFTTENKDQVLRKGNRIIFTAGKPPWYNSSGQFKEAFVIGIAGGSASGKTSVAQSIIESLDVPWVSLISMDSFYKQLTAEQLDEAHQCNYNFDDPNSFDLDLVASTLKRLKEGKNVEIPIYNFSTHQREEKKTKVYGASVVVFEGIFAFRKELIKYMDCKIFVEVDSDERLARRLSRDIIERGREVEGVLQQYLKFVKPAYDNFIESSRKEADVILTRGKDNKIGIEMIVNQVQKCLKERGFSFRSELINSKSSSLSVNFLPSSKQLKSLLTIIRDRTTSRDEFIFYSKHLMTMLVEYAVSLLPYQSYKVETVQGSLYEGVKLSCHSMCGVSIIRAGETMQEALRNVSKDVSIGKILIQTNPATGEPELLYWRLPEDIKNSYVILTDATIATGAAAMMAIRVLLDHEVPEENILLVALLMALPGVHSVAYAFPAVKLVTAELDKEVDNSYHIVPGFGNFGDRFFGTEP